MARSLSLLVAGAFAASVLAAQVAPAEEKTVPAPPRAHPTDPGYLGAEACRSCHPSAYDVWQKSAHARAWRSLPPERRGDPKCQSCHSPDPGGLAAGVQCESCHGNGRDYAFDFVMKDRPLARTLGLADAGLRRCKTCHLQDGVMSAFDYRSKMSAIAHPSR
jgi:hypothetical protein